MKFVGNSNEWYAFEKWLNKTVCQTKFGATEKLGILKQATIDRKAEKIVNRMDSFDDAYEKLRSIFGHKYKKLHKKLQHYFRKLYNIEATSAPSSDTITQLLLKADECVEVFKALTPNGFNECITCAIISS